MRTIWEILYSRQMSIRYQAPPICENIFSGSSSPVIVLSQPTLSQVIGLVLGGFGNFRLSWNQFPGAICYNVYRLEGVDTYVIQAQCITDLFYDLTLDGTYVVTAITLEGESPFSEPIVFSGGGGGISTVIVEASCPQTSRAGFPGVFKISRQPGDTSGILVVNFSLSGTAVNGVDFVTIPLTATIPNGLNFVLVDIDPIELELTASKSVTLTLEPGTYIIGTPSITTVELSYPYLRIVDYGNTQPLLVPAPAGGVIDNPGAPSNGCEWNGVWNLLTEFPPVPGPQYVLYYQDSDGNTIGGVNTAVQGTKMLSAVLSGPFSGFVKMQLQILGEQENGNLYIIWQGYKTTTGFNGTYLASGPNQSDTRASLDIEIYTP